MQNKGNLVTKLQRNGNMVQSRKSLISKINDLPIVKNLEKV